MRSFVLNPQKVLIYNKLCHVNPGKTVELEKDPDNRDTRAHVIDILGVLARWLRMGGFPPKLG